jgi:hypothetical protein
MSPNLWIALVGMATSTVVACFVPWLTNRYAAAQLRERIDAERETLSRQQQHEVEQRLYKEKLDSYTALLEADDRFELRMQGTVTAAQIIENHVDYLAPLRRAQLLGPPEFHEALLSLLISAVNVGNLIETASTVQQPFGAGAATYEALKQRIRDAKVVHAAARQALADLMRADLGSDSPGARLIEGRSLHVTSPASSAQIETKL